MELGKINLVEQSKRFDSLLTDGIRKIAYLIHVRVELLHVKVGFEGRVERLGIHHHYCTRRGSGRPLVDAHCRAAVGGALAQTRFERLDFIDIAGGLLGLGSGFLGIFIVGLDVLGHVFLPF